MDDPALVGGVQRLRHVRGDAHRFVHRELAFPIQAVLQ
jgi:hypothetical protein